MTRGVSGAAGRDHGKLARQRPLDPSKQRAGLAALGVASFLTTCLAGCSPSQFLLREREASRALAQAEQAHARALARYELTLSRQYLAKAREAAGEAHYQLALDLAQRSTASSQRARSLAIARAGDAVSGVSAE